jgi:sugar fermentation stimulation protein A
MEMKEAGYRAVLIFTVNRSDVISCGIASYIDPTYGQLLQDAMDKGVEVLAYRSQLGMTEIKLDRSLPVVIDA